MRTISRLFVASLLCAGAAPALAGPDEEVRGVLSAWAQAYTEGDHNKIALLYGRHARLIGVDTAVMIGPEAISEHFYFEAWHSKLRSVKLSEIKCYSYDDATATCAGGMEFVLTRRSGESLSQPSQFNVAFAYDDGVGQWLIHDHRVTRAIAVAFNPAAALQADAVKLAPVVVPASAATVPIK
jgi:hypothetical protein